MTIQSDQQAAPATGDAAIFAFKQFAKSFNWKVPSSGDGLASYSAIGDVITSDGAGANGMANPGAWFRLQVPNGAHEWLFQRGADSRTWTVLYSVARFTGGSPSATTRPTATDEVLKWDNATMLDADGSYRFNMSLDDAAPYGLYGWTFTIGGGVGCAFLFVDEPLLTGSTATEDTVPYVDCIDYSAGGDAGKYIRLAVAEDAWVPGRRLGGWYRYGLSGASYRPITALGYCIAGDVIAPPQGAVAIGANAMSGAGENPLRIVFARNSNLTYPRGWKGMSANMLWLATATPVARVTGDVLELGAGPTGPAYCLAGALWVPWERGVASLI